MKKVYLSLLLTGLGSTAVFGQYAPKALTSNQLSTEATKSQEAPVTKALGTTVWSSDFSTASDWTIDNDGQVGDFGWDIGSTEQSWYFTSGINSTSDGNYAELKNGNPTLAVPTQALDVVYTLTTTNPIDLTLSGTDVTLEFLQYGARFNDLQEIQISTDGVTFMTVGDNQDIDALSSAGGSAYANPTLKQINLATIISGATQIWVRFSWTTAYPTSATNPNVWITYGWFIDDVKVVTNPDYDLQVTSSYWGTAGLNYYQIPMDQVAPIDFSVNVFNGGTSAMTNSMLNVNVNSGAFTGSSAAANIAPLTSDSLFLTTQFTPSALGNYSVTRTITSDFTDDVPSNNALAPISFDVVNYIYARDNNTPSGSTTNGTDGFETGNLFDIWQDATVQAINVRLLGGGSGTTIGEEVYAKLYMINQTTGDFDYVAESYPLVVTAANLNTNLVLPLISETDVFADNTYLAVVGSFGPGLKVSNAGTSEPQTSFLLDAADGTWYYQTSTPYVRLNFDPGVGIEENNTNVKIGNVYPNPTSGSATINYSIENVTEVSVSIIDITGKTMLTSNEGMKNSGTHQLSFDAASFANGVYYVTLTSDESTVTKKFIKK